MGLWVGGRASIFPKLTWSEGLCEGWGEKNSWPGEPLPNFFSTLDLENILGVDLILGVYLICQFELEAPHFTTHFYKRFCFIFINERNVCQATVLFCVYITHGLFQSHANDILMSQIPCGNCPNCSLH